MIFIAYDFSDRIIDVVKSESEQIAEAYWIGKGIYPKKIVSEINIIPLEQNPNFEFIKHIARELNLRELKKRR